MGVGGCRIGARGRRCACADGWVLGAPLQGFVFSPKHKANSYARREATDLGATAAAAAAHASSAATAGGADLAAEQEEEY
jgi:hypothetical protein